MNPREKRMAITLGGLLALAAVAGGYMLIYSPYMAKRDQIAIVKKQVEDKEEKKNRYYTLAKLAEGYKAMSLPADPTTARREYDRVLSKLLTQAGAPPGFTVNPKPDSSRTTTPIMPNPEGTGVVTQGKEKYAYSKVVSDIKIAKVDLRILGEFLRAYHNLPLLQHISSMRITRKDEPASAAARRGRDRTDPDNWKDLEVLITTEALILDGADDRKGLIPFPKHAAAALGQAMYTGVKQTPDPGYALALAYAAARPPAASGANSREYLALVGKDIFHGPIPKEPEPDKPTVVPPPPPKENIDRFIKLNEITRRGDGSAKFELRDQASNFVYTGVLTPKGEKTSVDVSKTWHGPSGRPIKESQPLDKRSFLNISDDGKTASNYTFKVVAIDSVEGLVLAGSPAAKADTARVNGGGGGNRGGNRGGGFAPPGRLPAPKPNAALAGGWLATLPAADETFYYLKNGMSLKDMFAKPLKPAEVLDIVRRNSASGLNPYLNADVSLPVSEPVADAGGEK